jgi:hypothetical protein
MALQMGMKVGRWNCIGTWLADQNLIFRKVQELIHGGRERDKAETIHAGRVWVRACPKNMLPMRQLGH